jgi:hypothetical protein
LSRHLIHFAREREDSIFDEDSQAKVWRELFLRRTKCSFFAGNKPPKCA